MLRDCLAHRAALHPDRTFAVFESGAAWTYAELHRRACDVAANLRALGVAPADTVSAWLPNGPLALSLLFGVNLLGAVFAPIGVESRGELLRNAIAAAGARVLVTHRSLLLRLDEDVAAGIEHLLVEGGEGRFDAARLLGESPVLDPESLPALHPWDVQLLVATSGTTGASKFVPVTYAQTRATSDGFIALGGDDRALLNIPMAHVGGIGVPCRALYRGGSIAVVEAFSAASFWSTVRGFGITTLTLLGAMTDFLLAEPVRTDDCDHPLRHVIMVPIGANAEAFSARFGVDVYTVFNMTEVSCPIVSQRNALRPGSCGEARAGYELRLVDANDCEVPRGEVGELMLRADMPWAIATEYRGDAAATAAAWRNGWFHTGDRFCQDEDGYFYFVDRLKDAIRRRGENMSAQGIERAIAAFPGVREVAVVGVPSARGEEDVLAAIAMDAGAAFDRVRLIEHLVERLPYFMVPRYLRLLDALPKTASLKVMKASVRAEGVTADTWDREAEGGRLRRTRFSGGGEGGTG